MSGIYKKLVCWKLFYILIAFLIVMPLQGCHSKPKQTQTPSRPVKTAKAMAKDTPIYIESFGTLAAINNVDIKAQVTGKIIEVHFKEGDKVSVGDLLFVIDPREYKADLEKVQAILAEDMADLKLKRDTLDRNQKLFEQDLLSKQGFEQCETDLASVESKVQLDTANVELAKINLDYCYIKSPIAGITGKKQVDAGNIVTANTGPTLLNIKTIDPCDLDFTIIESELPALRKAMAGGTLKVEAFPEGDEEGPYEGKLTLVDNKVDNTTGTIALRAEIPNKERKLWAGQFVKARLILGIKKNAILVPYQALQLGQKGKYLFVVTPDNKADLRTVVTGNKIDDTVIIESGVKDGETVVTEGQLGLGPGVPVIDIALVKKQDSQKKGK